MSFAPYPDYRETGIDWLPKAPAHWAPKRLRHVVRLNPGKAGARRLAAESEVTFLPMEAIGEDGSVDRSQVRPIGSVLDGYTYLSEGDVAFAKITPCFENGKAALLTGLKGGIAFGTTELTVLRPEPNQTDRRYLYWLITSGPFREMGEASMYGAGGQKRVPDNFVRDFAIPIPPADQQRQIADFLEYETARIDALIEEQQRLIDLLQEKRQAVISQAVTKGLDPDVPMNDSCVDWLGEVPVHWDAKKLKFVSPQITVGIVVEPSKYYTDEGVPALRSLNVGQGEISEDNMVFISPDANEQLAKSKLREGDIVVVRSGQPGTAAVVPEELDGANCIDLIIIRKPRSGSETFISWCLAADCSLRQFSEGSGGAIQQHFNISTASHLVIPWPPADEQAAIAEYIEQELDSLTELIDTAQRQIDLLNERRSALISAAVTGKIDVRDWKSQNASVENDLPMVAEPEQPYG